MRRVGGEEDGVVVDDEELFRRWKWEYYHMGSFHGKPSGCLMHDSSYSLGKDTNNELLCLACLSLTDQFVHQRLTDERYQDGVTEQEQHINSSPRNLKALTTVTLKDGTLIRAPESTRIACQDEPRLMLVGQWNLFESMLYSSYIATKLKTWTHKGEKKLMPVLARMGFATVDCQGKFQYMTLELEPDVVYGVTALLESSVNSDGSSTSKQFGVAYDPLSLKNLDKLRSGMQQAIAVQNVILSQESAAITKVRSERKFRWVKLEDSMDAKLLGYPQALTRFCYFLMDAMREK
ncbi:hypothetical protein Tsubulata_039000 [Turnera subulata]|uniref:Uncharacterized protein n=1 Tax=Turnera subulata TaxID=218843 RepID=A0A9Q0F1E4_9ROSI|nr:hypothetical protein Tsubulata_039000 [Turnera subulata]